MSTPIRIGAVEADTGMTVELSGGMTAKVVGHGPSIHGEHTAYIEIRRPDGSLVEGGNLYEQTNASVVGINIEHD